METHRIETIVQPRGTIHIENLPFEEGKSVELIIMETADEKPRSEENSLKGTLLKYDDPFGPAAPIEDWEALK